MESDFLLPDSCLTASNILRPSSVLLIGSVRLFATSILRLFHRFFMSFDLESFLISSPICLCIHYYSEVVAIVFFPLTFQQLHYQKSGVSFAVAHVDPQQGQKEIAACPESLFFPLFATNFMYSLMYSLLKIAVSQILAKIIAKSFCPWPTVEIAAVSTLSNSLPNCWQVSLEE